VGTIILSVFNYLYNTFMGRFLGPANYGVIGSLLAFIGIITMPTNAVATIGMRFAAHYNAKNDLATIHGFFQRMTRQLTLVGIAAALIILIISPWLTSFLKLPSIVPVILVSPIIIFMVLLPLNRGILQGLQRFTDSIINQSVDPLLKLVLGILLVRFVGWGVNGAIVAIVFATLAAYYIGYLPLKPILKTPAAPLKTIPQEVKQYSFVALAAFLIATTLMNIDILLVKHYLPAHEAGLYTALSNIGKIILFVSSPVVSVMFPMISDLHGRAEKHYHLLVQSILLVILICVVGVSGYFLLPEFVITVLYGSAYLSIAPLLGLFGIVMMLYSLINLWVNYFLSIGDSRFVWWLAASAIVEIGGLIIYHSNFVSVVEVLLVAMVVGFTGLTAYYLYGKRDRLMEILSEHFAIMRS
jgi:O-antigen/teichoic acid export membrane protein